MVELERTIEGRVTTKYSNNKTIIIESEADLK